MKLLVGISINASMLMSGGFSVHQCVDAYEWWIQCAECMDAYKWTRRDHLSVWNWVLVLTDSWWFGWVGVYLEI